jgi:hypothetical protein
MGISLVDCGFNKTHVICGYEVEDGLCLDLKGLKVS